MSENGRNAILEVRGGGRRGSCNVVRLRLRNN